MRRLIVWLTATVMLVSVPSGAWAQNPNAEEAKKRAEEAKKNKGGRQGQGQNVDRENAEQSAQERADEARAEHDDGPNTAAIVGGIAAAAVVGTLIAKKKGGGDDKADAKAGAKPAASGSETTTFSSMDTDKDGALSRNEFTTKMTSAFKAADGNSDGVLTREETQEQYGDQGAAYFDALDKDAAGKVDSAAFQANVLRVFDSVDADDDFKISTAERDAAKKNVGKPATADAATTAEAADDAKGKKGKEAGLKRKPGSLSPTECGSIPLLDDGVAPLHEQGRTSWLGHVPLL